MRRGRLLVAVALACACGAAIASARAAPPQRLSLAQLAGQRIIYAYAGLQPPPALLAAIRAGTAAGVIFFAPNISSPAQLRAVVGELARANAASPVRAPLLMLTDQEGGLVRRLPGAPVLSQKAIGQSANGPALASSAGAGAAGNLRRAGIDVDLAPVLDVYRHAGNFIDAYGRSYGSLAGPVGALGARFITALQRGGVAATAKHFPGLGSASASEDTDARAVTLSVSRAQLRAVDEAPYAAAIAAGVKLVMVSWATYPALDGARPAGFSRAVIGGELRSRLHFGGVTITDGLGAGSLARFGGFARRAVLAATAGADLLLCSVPDANANTPSNGAAALGGLAQALRSGLLSRRVAEQAAARVLALRRGI